MASQNIVFMTSVVMILSLTLTLVSPQNCKFPDVLQTKHSLSWWMHHVTYAGAQTTNNTIFFVGVVRDKLSITALSGAQVKQAPKSYERLCFRELPNNKYLVQHFEKHLKGSHFLCMQFFIRSANVVQWKESLLSKRDDDTLCDDSELHMDPWPLVRYETAARGHSECPLTGGYNMRLVDSAGYELCPERSTDTRMEVSCAGDQLVHLDFHTCHYGQSIIGMERRQKLHCVAYWKDGPSTYLVLKRNGVYMFWILYIPRMDEVSFQAYLSSDVVVESGDVMALSGRYVKLLLQRKVYSSACDDVSGVCEEACDTAESVFTDMYCRHICERCNHSNTSQRYDECSSLQSLAGQWQTLTPEGAATMTVAPDATLDMNGVRSRCVEYNLWTSTYSLLHFSEAGCYPRYYCLTTHPVTPNVLLYKYVLGPMFGAHQLCSTFMARNNLKGTAQHYHLAIKPSKLEPIPCGFPKGTFISHVKMSDGATCHGHVHNSNCDVREESSNSITIHQARCSDETYETSYNLTCMALMPSISTKKLVLVAKNTLPVQYLCLYFSAEMTEFVTLPGSKCHEVYNSDDVTEYYTLTRISDRCPNEAQETSSLQKEMAKFASEKYSNNIRDYLSQSNKIGIELPSDPKHNVYGAAEATNQQEEAISTRNRVGNATEVPGLRSRNNACHVISRLNHETTAMLVTLALCNIFLL